MRSGEGRYKQALVSFVIWKHPSNAKLRLTFAHTMKLSKSVIQSILFTIVGSLPFLSALVLLPFYSNYLSTENFGLLNVYISLSLLFQIITSFGVEQYIPVLINEKGNEFTTRLRASYGLQLLVGLGVLFIALLVGDFALSAIYQNDSLSFFPFGLLSVVTGFFNGYFRSETTYLTFDHQIRRYFFANFFNFFVTIALSIFLIHSMGDTILGPLLGRLFSGMLIFFLALYFQRADRFPVININEFRSISRITSVMFGYTFLMWILSYLDRFILTAYVSLGDIAIYDFATKCLLPVEFVMIGLTNFVLPKIYSSWSGNLSRPPMEKAKTLLHALTVACVFSICLTIIGIPVVAPWIIKNAELYKSFPLMGLVGISYLTRAIFSLYLGILMLRKEVSAAVRGLFYSALLHVLALFFTVPSLGIEGALWIGIASKILMVLFLQKEVKKKVSMSFNARKLIVYPALMSVVFASTYFLSARFNYTLIGISTLVPAFFFTYFFFQKDLKKAIGLILDSSKNVDSRA